MAELEAELKNLEQKVKLLLKQFQHLQKEKNSLTAELEKMRIAFNHKNELVQQLQQQVTILKLGTASMKSSDKKQLEERIDSYLKDVEKCLSLLNA